VQHIALGEAIIRPKQPVVAGSFTTITFTYTAGHPIDDSGYVKVVFRSLGDFGPPQFDDPTAPDYCTVHTTGDCRVEPRWDPRGHTRPWSRALFLKVRGGFLNEGEEITVVFGDTSAGSPGWQMQTFGQETFEFKTLVDYFTFARHYGLLDISAHQGNDFQVTDEFWETINKVTKEFYRPGVFVTFPGYEWSGNTPLGGDRNVYFTSEGGQISRSCTDLLPGKHSAYENSPTAAELFENLRKHEGPRPFVFAHVGGRYADLSMHDPEIELAVEVHSAWGTFEWLVEDALRRGYRVGICANSDGHKCRPGASYPGASEFGSLGGLTCVLARKLDRENIAEALHARHFYATTGNRCLVDVELVTADGRSAMMGDVIDAGTGTPRLHVRVIGSAPIESVEVRNGLETVNTLRPYGEDDLGRRVKIVWSGAEVRGRDRMVAWDGGLYVQGNAILNATPVNFWNANQPLQKIGSDQLAWKSMTTGGVSGVILSLEKQRAGSLEIETIQLRVKCAIGSVGIEPKAWECGGLQKKIEVYRLPDRQRSCEFSFTLPLTKLHKGDNPIYIRMTQEDGHMAWTSPVYLV